MGLKALASGVANITGGTIQVDNGSEATPSYAFATEPDCGFYYSGTANQINVSAGGTARWMWNTGRMLFTSAYLVSWSSGAIGASVDLVLSRQGAGVLGINPGTATPAGGGGVALVFGSTAGFGIYIGSGLPTVSAAQGSIYLRSDGSSTSTRLYVNTNGTTGWTNVTTAT